MRLPNIFTALLLTVSVWTVGYAITLDEKTIRHSVYSAEDRKQVVETLRLAYKSGNLSVIKPLLTEGNIRKNNWFFSDETRTLVFLSYYYNVLSYEYAGESQVGPMKWKVTYRSTKEPSLTHSYILVDRNGRIKIAAETAS